MLAELPFVTAEDVAAEFRPRGTTATKSVLETLKRRGLLSVGITEPLRGPGGQTRGTLRLYSVLTRDAAACAASGDTDRARRLVDAANRLERRGDASKLVGIWARTALTTPNLERSLSGLMRWTAQEKSVSGDLIRHLEALGQERRQLPPPSETAFGYVARIHGSIATVSLDGGGDLPFPTARLNPTEAFRVGCPVAIRWTDMAKGVWMTAEPAIELSAEDDPIYPFDDRRNAPPIIPSTVLEAPPTVRRSRRTSLVD